jgi:predicted GIY-YIG superfamily endonuclease
VTLAWKRRVMSWSRALKEEIRIKSLTRAQKEELLSVIVVKRKRKKS